MAINLPANIFGVTVFLGILIFLQFFFGMIGWLFSGFIGLTGLFKWIMTIGVILIGDSIFVNID